MGCFRGVYISRTSQFAKLFFMKIMENHTHVPSVTTSWVQSSLKFSFRKIRIHPSKKTHYTHYTVFHAIQCTQHWLCVQGIQNVVDVCLVVCNVLSVLTHQLPVVLWTYGGRGRGKGMALSYIVIISLQLIIHAASQHKMSWTLNLLHIIFASLQATTTCIYMYMYLYLYWQHYNLRPCLATV